MTQRKIKMEKDQNVSVKSDFSTSIRFQTT